MNLRQRLPRCQASARPGSSDARGPASGAGADGTIAFLSDSVPQGEADGDQLHFSEGLESELAKEINLVDTPLRARLGWYLWHRILANPASRAQAELSDILIVRNASDLRPRMPPWLSTLL